MFVFSSTPQPALLSVTIVFSALNSTSSSSNSILTLSTRVLIISSLETIKAELLLIFVVSCVTFRSILLSIVAILLSMYVLNVLFNVLILLDNTLETVSTVELTACICSDSSQLSLLDLTKESKLSNLTPSAATSRVLMLPSTVKPP